MSEINAELFQQFHDWIERIAPPVKPEARCAECGGVIYLIHGRHSKKWFWSHRGLSGCEDVRAIIFDTREAAEQATEVFQ